MCPIMVMMKVLNRIKLMLPLVVLMLSVMNRCCMAEQGPTTGSTVSSVDFAAQLHVSQNVTPSQQSPEPPSQEQELAKDVVMPEIIQPPQALHLTTLVPLGRPFDDETVSMTPSDGLDGRKRRRLGRKRKRRPLQDDYWQGTPRDEEQEGGSFYRGGEQEVTFTPLERKRTHSRWEGTGGGTGLRPRPDRWTNPYSDAVDPQFPVSSGPPSRLRPYETSNPGRENFPPIDGNRQRRLPRPEEPVTTTSGYKAYRKPYSQAKRNEEENGGSSGEAGKGATADLKTLLKQSGGVSLSEILQQRNISLQDLIKGKQMALAALTQSPLDSQTMTETDNEVTSIVPTLSSVQFRVQDDTTAKPDYNDIKTIKRIPVYSPSAAPMIATENPTSTSSTTTTSQPGPSGQEETNSVEDIITLDNLGGRNDNVAIFPTVEVKQLALNPVLPTVKEERLRPIKGVASRIRPDLSNSNIRTEEIFAASKKRYENSKSFATAESWHSSSTIGPGPVVVGSTVRERWTPSPGLYEKREQFLQKLNQNKVRNRPSSTVSTETHGDAPEEHGGRVSPEAESSNQTSTERSPLMRIPSARNRLSIKPKSRTSPPSPPPIPVQTQSTESHSLADVEFHEEAENVTKLLETEEPELNIIEKFTSFEETKAHGEPPEPPVSSSDTTTSEGEPLNEDDLIERINQNTQRSFTDSMEDYFRDVTESNPSLFNDLGPITLSDDKREILELMEDRRIGARLAKVLSQRNMTLDELLEHRKRGSSQLHLSEIINSKVKPMEEKMDIVTAFEHFPRFNIGNLRSIRPDDIKQDSQGFSYFTSIINIRPTDEIYKEARSMQDRDHHREHKFLDWKLQHPHSVNHKMDGVHFLGSGGSKGGLITPSRMSADAEFDSGNDQSSDLLDLELTGHGFNHRHTVTIESASMPLGVRSAIVASACIVGVSLAIFAVIFVVCRWRQRRRNKLNYTENFNMAKGQLPMMHGEGRKTPLNDQVVYTTGQHLQQMPLQRKDSKVNTMDPNSQEVHDYLWDTMRKPFQ
ncbi:uncharacterized protein LOC131432448 [Malaya genurostris]|uniref:uncharacterized protein LOC131432448 n=1 Tax=Malaya genurostris TaxID=325434 RepID=UPI0026F3E2B5|nr:uncharacterized protein LOC131432448 [Malaya genurostris]